MNGFPPVFRTNTTHIFSNVRKIQNLFKHTVEELTVSNHYFLFYSLRSCWELQMKGRETKRYDLTFLKVDTDQFWKKGRHCWSEPDPKKMDFLSHENALGNQSVDISCYCGWDPIVLKK